MQDNYFIYLNLDGFAQSYYKIANSLLSGTPNLNKIIEKGIYFENCFTGIPSITFQMQSSIISGAYSNVTKNSYKYYNKKTSRVQSCKHLNEGETIGEVLQRIKEPFISIQQFTLNEKGCSYDQEDYTYFQPGGNYKTRFNMLKQVLLGKEIVSKSKFFSYKAIPKYIFMYVDDLDALGHNPLYTSYKPYRIKALTEKSRELKTSQRLIEIDYEIGEIISILKRKGIYDKVNFLLTSDHGMVPAQGFSSINKLVKVFNEMGYKKVCIAKDDTPPANFEEADIILLSTGIQCQVYVMKEHSPLDLERIKRKIFGQIYVESCLTLQELKAKGVQEEFADLLISPIPPNHFNTYKQFQTLNGGHDSLNIQAQKVFALMAGPSFKQGLVIQEQVSNIDFIPTICKANKIPIMRGSQGKIMHHIFNHSYSSDQIK